MIITVIYLTNHMDMSLIITWTFIFSPNWATWKGSFWLVHWEVQILQYQTVHCKSFSQNEATIRIVTPLEWEACHSLVTLALYQVQVVLAVCRYLPCETKIPIFICSEQKEKEKSVSQATGTYLYVYLVWMLQHPPLLPPLHLRHHPAAPSHVPMQACDQSWSAPG